MDYSQYKESYLEIINRKTWIIKDLSDSGSKGNLKKWLCLIEGYGNTHFYIKTHSTGKGIKYGYECESECIASRLGTMLGLNCVQYILDYFIVDNFRYKVCVSQDFAIQGIESSSIAKLCNKCTSYIGEAKYKYIIEKLPHLKSEIDSVLLFDDIINNHDRHLNNINVYLYDTPILVPVYDSGDSLFATLTVEEMKYAMKRPLNYTKCKPFMSVHEAQRKIIGPVTFNQVNKAAVYRLVNEFLKGQRAKIINKWLITKLKELNLLC